MHETLPERNIILICIIYELTYRHLYALLFHCAT